MASGAGIAFLTDSRAAAAAAVVAVAFDVHVPSPKVGARVSLAGEPN